MFRTCLKWPGQDTKSSFEILSVGILSIGIYSAHHDDNVDDDDDDDRDDKLYGDFHDDDDDADDNVDDEDDQWMLLAALLQYIWIQRLDASVSFVQFIQIDCSQW